MTIQEMKVLVQKHADSENKHDLEGTLATLVENPVYEIFPARLKLQGKENVRAFYREHFNSFFPLIVSFQLINEWWNPESACMEYDLFLKAPYDQMPHRILVILTAKNNLLLGERFYISEELAQIMSGTAFSRWEKF
ncbi:MAG: nuclear transport factor 2 family protein [Candidatus Babeliales bacterium]|nr:nuclear transport factor 2 family protein [Candidatus Babeliales bacterium]